MRRFHEKGFTLIELMVVVAIVAMLAAFAIPQYKKYRRRASYTDAIALAQQIVAFEERQRLTSGSYQSLNISSSTSQQVYSDGRGGKIIIPPSTSVSVSLSTCSVNDLSGSNSTFNQPGFALTLTRSNAPGGSLQVGYNSCTDDRPHPI